MVDMYNNIVETGKYPEEINLGILIPLQKPCKTDNLRPISNLVRKILSIIMLNRINNKLDKEISCSQTAYRDGRSTTENVYVCKTLVEKALVSNNFDCHLLFLDMNKAFDSVKRNLLLEDLKQVVSSDELHILSLLIQDVNIRVRNGSELGSKFETNLGIPQGDCLSPILFTFFLVNSLKEQNETSSTAKDCNCLTKQPSKDLNTAQQFADDLNYISSSLSKINDKKECHRKVKKEKSYNK